MDGGAGRVPSGHHWVSLLAVTPILAVLIAAAFPVRAAAASDAVTVQLLPAAVTLSAGEMATVDMLITNTTSSAVRVTAVDIGVPAEVTAENVPAPDSIGPIPPGGSVLSHFELQASPGIESGDVDVLLEIPAGSPGGAEQFVTGRLALTAGQAAAAPAVTFVSFPDKLNDGQSVTAAVSISDSSPFVFRQVQVTAVDSEDLTLGPVTPPQRPFAACPPASASGSTLVGCLATLAPGTTAVLYLRVTASSRVQTGTQHVAVVVTGQTGPSGDPITATTVATTSAQVAIFGVDALSPFGLGTLFVLPGLVAALVFLLLARYVYPKGKELPETVQFTDARTVVFVVPPAALAYLLVWAVWGVNLTNQAGTQDVVVLFALGAGLGFLAWAIVAAIFFERTGRKQFTVSDSPAKVLRRLKAREARLELPVVVVSENLRYRYLSGGPGGQLYTCPPIGYWHPDGVSDDDRRHFRDALSHSRIGDVLSEVQAGHVRLCWEGTGVTLLDQSKAQIQGTDRIYDEIQPGDEDEPDAK